MAARPQLPEARIAPESIAQMASFHEQVVREVEEAIASNDVVVVGMRQNPFPRKARKLLDEAGVPYRYLEYGSYLGGWKPRLALKLWSGWPTFPQVFVKGVLVGGAAEVAKALSDGSLKARLEAK